MGIADNNKTPSMFTGILTFVVEASPPFLCSATFCELITQVGGAQIAVDVQQLTSHCRQTMISGIHKYDTQGNDLQKNNWWS